MIVKTARQSDEHATGQHASANTAMKMHETVETDRETSETDENWQTVKNQRSNKLQKNQYPCTNDNDEFLWIDGPSESENWWSSLLLLFWRQ